MLNPAAIIFVPAPMMPPIENPLPLSDWLDSKAFAPGILSMSAFTLSAGPSLRRKSRIMPTDFSAALRSTPTLATRRPIKSSMIPSRPRVCGGIAFILNAVSADDKHDAVSITCSDITPRTSRKSQSREMRRPRYEFKSTDADLHDAAIAYGDNVRQPTTIGSNVRAQIQHVRS